MKYFNVLFVLFAVLLVFVSADEGVDRCTLPARVGRCRGLLPRFYYDAASNECKEFKYGGCGGNENNFKRIEQCEAACKKS